MDATHFHRRSGDEIEVIIVQQAQDLMTFFLNRQPIAKLGQGEAMRLYLSPGRYRFGAILVVNWVLSPLAEMNANVTPDTRQLYRIFQSSGFTSSGGNAVFEISQVKASAQ
jgi:hypothetical protein